MTAVGRIVDRSVPLLTPVVSAEYPLAKVVGFYLWFGGEVAEQKADGNLECRRDMTQTTNWVATTLKVASMLLSCGILPLIALLIQYAFRSSHNFQWEVTPAPEAGVPATPLPGPITVPQTPVAGLTEDELLIAQMLQEDLNNADPKPVAPKAKNKALDLLPLLAKKNEDGEDLNKKIEDAMNANPIDQQALDALMKQQDDFNTELATVSTLKVEEITQYFADRHNDLRKDAPRLESKDVIAHYKIVPADLKGLELARKLDAALVVEGVRIQADADRLLRAVQDAEAAEAEQMDAEVKPAAPLVVPAAAAVAAPSDKTQEELVAEALAVLKKSAELFDKLENSAIREERTKIRLEIKQLDWLTNAQITAHFAEQYNADLQPDEPMTADTILAHFGINDNLVPESLVRRLHRQIKTEGDKKSIEVANKLTADEEKEALQVAAPAVALAAAPAPIATPAPVAPVVVPAPAAPTPAATVNQVSVPTARQLALRGAWAQRGGALPKPAPTTADKK